MAKQKILGPISGYTEWLPEIRAAELAWFATIRRVFESFGYTSIETPSVELIDSLLKKGETDKEIYVLQRLQGEDDDESRLGLHFDLTVPFARYVADHYNDLVFPFKRYQMQRVWRGERPKDGRFREFYQCDIDVVDNEDVSTHYDIEVPLVISEALRALPVGEFEIVLSNRKILAGYLQGLGIEDVAPVIRILDKLDKIGPEGVQQTLQDEVSLSSTLAKACLNLATIRTHDERFVDEVRALGVNSPALDQGLEELTFVLKGLVENGGKHFVVDLSLARGFDYYTGVVYEGLLKKYPEIGSVCSGGRYEDLAGSFINKRLPGVGMSIGLTRIFAKMVKENHLEAGPQSPTQILVVVPSEERRQAAAATAAILRTRGFNVELHQRWRKLAQQIRYAARKGIPYVWFPPFDDVAGHELKIMASGEQIPVDPNAWRPED